MTTKDITTWIKTERISQGLSQEYITYRCGLGTNTLGCYERGIRIPRLDIILTILDVLGYQISIRKKTEAKNHRITREYAQNDFKFNEWLKTERTKKNYSIRELSRRSGVHYSTIAKIEGNKISAKVHEAIALSESLGYSMMPIKE